MPSPELLNLGGGDGHGPTRSAVKGSWISIKAAALRCMLPSREAVAYQFELADTVTKRATGVCMRKGGGGERGGAMSALGQAMCRAGPVPAALILMAWKGPRHWRRHPPRLFGSFSMSLIAAVA